jgi:hypothetical protein
MRTKTRTFLGAAALAAPLVALACGTPGDSMTGHNHAANPAIAAKVSGEVKADVARLRALIAPFHSPAAAQAAGFDEPVSPCIASPEGGMGFHWANLDRIDAEVQWDEPEQLVFAPSPEGVKLAAVEYIVPMALSAEAPELFGETFVPGGPGESLWTLHVWTGIHNPSGLFAPWNPEVTCP